MSNNEIIINKVGIYNINFNITTESSGSNTRVTTGCVLEANYNNAGYFIVSGTSFYIYNRSISGNKKGSNSSNCILQLNVNDKLRLVTYLDAGSEITKSLANACSIAITKL